MSNTMVDTRYGVLDYVQICIPYGCFILSAKTFGWPGVIGFFIVNWLIQRLLWIFFGLEPMSGGDSIFFLDDERGQANIISAMRMEKFNRKEIMDHMANKALPFSRIRATISKVFGLWYFKHHSKEWYWKNY